MKLVSFIHKGKTSAGLVSGELVYEIYLQHTGMAGSMTELLTHWVENYPGLRQYSEEIEISNKWKSRSVHVNEIELLAPLPFPNSLRDGYAFRQHVETARRNRGLEMTTVFDAFPVFYFGNHRTVYGQGAVFCMPDHFKKLDFELEAAVVISKNGKNIPADKADDYIAGLMILNDFSARTLQMDEMLLNLGPAKGKDFATTTGPWLVTTEELKSNEVPCKKNHTGKSWNLKMTASVNGKPVSSGNLADMDWTFAELIARSSYGAELFPGDIIGSGTVGTGCFLELNGTGKLKNTEYTEQWLHAGDTIELQIESLGTLRNNIVKEPTEYSILQLKKA